MSGKSVVKFVIAFGIVAVLLVFLGVNYVPRISALSSISGNSVDAAKYAGSDYFERHPFARPESISNAVRPANSGSSSYNQLSDNPELAAVQRFEAGSAQENGIQGSPSENPELLLSRRFAADKANNKEPLYKILAENPELILSRRYAQEHNR